MANRLFEVQRFAPGSAWGLALLAPDAPDGTPRLAALTGQGGKLLVDECSGSAYKVPYAAYLRAGTGHFIGGWRQDEETLEYGKVVRTRATENANGPNAIAVSAMAYARDLAQGATPPTFGDVWQRLATRAAINADGFAPMLHNVADFPTARTHYATNILGGNISLEAYVTLKGERMAAFSWQDEYGNTYQMPGDAMIAGSVSANNDTTQHAADKTDFQLHPLFLLFPNVSAGARLRLHFNMRAQLAASVATGNGTWRPANVSVANLTFALYAPPKAFTDSETLLQGNYTAAGTLTIPLALAPVADEDGRGYAYLEKKIALDVTVPPSKALLLTWADGLIKSLVEALAADATAYTNDPTDGPEERKHRERLRAELTFTLALDPLLTEEPLEETT